MNIGKRPNWLIYPADVKQIISKVNKKNIVEFKLKKKIFSGDKNYYSYIFIDGYVHIVEQQMLHTCLLIDLEINYLLMFSGKY